jgi:molecular chaperone DnaK
MVYDLGGGTFDVSIIDIGDGVIEVLATSGNNHLGGDDFDDRIIKYLISEFKKLESIDLGQDKMAMQRLKEAAEKAKKELSTVTTSNINLPFITMNQDGPKHLDINLTRSRFEELIHDLIESTVGPVQTALKDADLAAGELSKVLLVGGSTRIPAVQDLVKRLTGKDPFKGINPDECVALGASIQGGKLAGDAGAGNILLLDVTPLSLGIETLGGVATKLIDRNTTIPTNKKQIFSTAENNQTAVDIHVFQGERPLARDNKTLGQFRLDGIPPAPRGVPQIEVMFDIDANGIVHVSAKDLGTGKEQKIAITASTNLSDAEIDRAVKEAEQFAESDRKRKEAIDTKNEADSLIFQTEKMLSDLGDKVSDTDKTNIQSELSKLKTVNESMKVDNMSDADAATLKTAIESYTKVLNDFSTKLYQQAGPQAGSASDSSSQPEPGDDVVDGEYTEK